MERVKYQGFAWNDYRAHHNKLLYDVLTILLPLLQRNSKFKPEMSGQSAKTHEDIEAKIIIIKQRAQSKIILIQQQAQSEIKLIQQQAEAQIALIQQQARCRDRVLTLPDVFRIIIQMVGLESLNDLHRCRQVCSSWNQKILSLVWRSETSRRILMARIRSNWGPGLLPTDEEISRAKSLGEGCLFLEFTMSHLFDFRKERHPRLCPHQQSD